jgi:hypothetical protein
MASPFLASSETLLCPKSDQHGDSNPTGYDPPQAWTSGSAVGGISRFIRGSHYLTADVITIIGDPMPSLI